MSEQHRPQSRRSNIHLFLDWDGTITKKNTVPLLATIAPKQPDCPDYQWFLSEYLRDYEDHATSYRPEKAARTLLKEEYAWLDSLEAVERSSIKRIEKRGLFKDVRWTNNDISVFEEHAKGVVQKHEVTIRKGVGDLIESGIANGACDIVSVNWSAHWMRCVLREALEQKYELKGLTVIANEIAGDGSGMLSRLKSTENGGYEVFWDKSISTTDTDNLDLSHGIWTSGHKAMIMQAIMNQKDNRQDWVSVYVGDSNTDLQCLMQADVGICIRDEELTPEQQGLSSTLERLRIPYFGLEQFRTECLAAANTIREKNLWYARDMAQIWKAIYPLDES